MWWFVEFESGNWILVQDYLLPRMGEPLNTFRLGEGFLSACGEGRSCVSEEE